MLIARHSSVKTHKHYTLQSAERGHATFK